MSEQYMRESDIYRCFYNFWEKHKSIGECLDMVPKYSLDELIEKAAGQGGSNDAAGPGKSQENK